MKKLKVQFSVMFILLIILSYCNEKPQIKVQRFGSIIGLKKQYEERYIILHKHAFPGVLDRIHKCNIRNYTIFLNDGILFSHFEYIGSDFKVDMEAMSDETTNEWWKLTDPMQKPLENRKEGEWWSSLELIYQLNRSKVPYVHAQRKAFIGTLKEDQRDPFVVRLNKIDEPLIEVLFDENFQNLTDYAIDNNVYFYSEYVGDDYNADVRKLYSNERFRSLDSDLRSMLQEDAQKRTWISMKEVFHTN